MFDDADSTVSEGSTTADVCVSVTGGGATELGCPLTITLTTNHGKAGILTYMYNEVLVPYLYMYM